MRTARSATAMMVDLRDFTPMFQDADTPEEEERFLAFLERFYTECVVASEATGATPSDDTLYVSSTGDGVLVVFFDPEWHTEQAYAAAILLCHRLPPLFTEHGYVRFPTPVDCFGIGVESGPVYVVRAATEATKIVTCIGDAINIAARLEGHTKALFRTPLIVGQEANQRLTERLRPGFDYGAKVRQVLEASGTEQVARLFGEMDAANRDLRIKFINHLYLKGVSEPEAAFRYSPSLAQSTEGVVRLFERLFAAAPDRAAAVRALLT